MTRRQRRKSRKRNPVAEILRKDPRYRKQLHTTNHKHKREQQELREFRKEVLDYD